MQLCLKAAQDGNPNSVTDAGTGFLLALAGLSGALMNVQINMKTLADETLMKDISQECDRLVSQTAALKAQYKTTFSSMVNYVLL